MDSAQLETQIHSLSRARSRRRVGKGSLVTSKARYTGWMIRRKTGLRSRNKLGIKKGGKTHHKAVLGLPEPKVWSLTRADIAFRAHMLKMVVNKCVFPDCPITDPKKLTVSHYHGRVKKGTRFYLPNVDFLCRNHHYWDKQLGYEFQKQRREIHGWDGRYTIYMREKLGERGFLALENLANSGMKPKVAIKQFQASLNEGRAIERPPQEN